MPDKPDDLELRRVRALEAIARETKRANDLAEYHHQTPAPKENWDRRLARWLAEGWAWQ